MGGYGCRRTPSDPPPTPVALAYAQELPQGAVALQKVSPGDHPHFTPALTAANIDALRVAVNHSLDYLSRPGSRTVYPYLDVSHDRAVATLHAFREILSSRELLGDPNRLPRHIAERFDVYKSVGAPSQDGRAYTGKVLFTGYFTPTYEASLTRTPEFRWPLYRRPPDLPVGPGGETNGRYATRAEIEGGGRLAGHEIVWLRDRWEAYVVTVQGSARLRLRDGRILELGYAGHNGHDYASPAMRMVADGVIRKEDVRAETLRRYFRQHPQDMDKYLWHNPRTVFFTERPGGPFGSLNVPVTPMATIATDKKVYPPALPAFVRLTPDPRKGQRSPLGAAQQFMLDQDTGGAIRAAGRADLYTGVGDEAETLAGEQLSEGELYYLVVKEHLVPQYLNRGTGANYSADSD